MPEQRQARTRLRRSYRLLQSRDFQRVARNGRRAASRDFVMLIAPSRVSSRRIEETVEQSVVQTVEQTVEPVRRLGVTASRKVGNAVVRNRVKRRIREWFRASRQTLVADVDVVVIARRAAAELSGRDVGVRLSALLDELRTPSDERRAPPEERKAPSQQRSGPLADGTPHA